MFIKRAKELCLATNYAFVLDNAFVSICKIRYMHGTLGDNEV